MSVPYYSPGPVADAFLADWAHQFIGLMGPIGSGKSVGCIMKLVMCSLMQEPTVDEHGKPVARRTRHVCVRNTYGELKATTIKTWLDWFPEDQYGKVKWDVPIQHNIKFEGDDGIDVDMEVWFLALDRPDHVKKLLSLEATMIWFNEAREIPKALVDAAMGRVSRYPSQKDRPAHISEHDWPTNFAVIADTNPPDDDHWWYELAEELKPDTYSFYRQPDGLSAEAENRQNLHPTYYERIQDGKTEEWVNVYVRGKYGTVHDGKKVFPEYNDRIHCAPDILPVYRALPLLMGWDFGLTPAVIFGQMTPRGQLRIIDELVAEDMGIASFVENVVKPHLTNHYNGMKLISDGDPAGNSRAQTDEDTCLDVLKRHGILTQSARTNNFIARRESVVWFLSRMIDGQPGFLLSPQCRTLRKGFNGGYRYRRLQVPGEERFTDEPDKNRFSHPMDGLQYLCLRQQIPADIKKKSTAGTRGSRDTHGPADSRSGY